MNKNVSKQSVLNNVIISLAVIGLLLSGVFTVKNKLDRRVARRKISENKFKLRENAAERKAYMATSLEFTQNARLNKVIDSLNKVNDTMTNNAIDEYFERVNSKYTLNSFFTQEQIKNINKVVDSFVRDYTFQDTTAYDFIIEAIPFDKNTTLATFETVVRTLEIPSLALKNAGVLFDMGYIFMFADDQAQKEFYNYLDDCDNAWNLDETPNLLIPEMTTRLKQYRKNATMINRLGELTRYNDSLAQKKLAQFDTIQNRLNQEIQRYQAKLK